MNEKKLEIVLASPRGFCAGVDRAILIVEKALEKWGPPIYVRHEIVHNRQVVERLQARGVVLLKKSVTSPKEPMPFSPLMEYPQQFDNKPKNKVWK